MSLLGVTTAVSFGVNTFDSLNSWFTGALYWPEDWSAKYSYMIP